LPASGTSIGGGYGLGGPTQYSQANLAMRFLHGVM